MTEPYIETTDCHVCKFEREEYGAYRCPAHYNLDEDNARAIRQTGYGVIDALTERELRVLRRLIVFDK
jgi:hypothetical protein